MKIREFQSELWRTRINAWQPPHRFVDEQLRGPDRLGRHEHTFEARDVVR